ncbi:SpoIIE family protein phosphatase [Paracrocinitomix mangrovi]|uniref:PP2C family protein-serine/threonine phosphatase n=1 Tax=Paracrocinitomix mangrovi TaxID=2862509 RepID=UPI001C8EDF3C|nr:SpoIIE family protein phosphatase [Paracrocinitomix mangrovi]UKN01907.1 SpoIIE family protein phosphatase [Paracrocinitomix mangrovi]
MSNLIVRIFTNLSTRIMFIFYLSIILITAFFIIFGYYTQLNLQEQRQYDKLKAIVSATSAAIDGDEHQRMMEDHTTKDAITSNDQNMTYHMIRDVMTKTSEFNNLNSAMYTMVYNKSKDVFEFGVTSAEEPYFRHEYHDYPSLLVEKMDIGGTVPRYEDKHGVWISAFHPIKNGKGETVAILQADVRFNEFIDMVRSKYAQESLIALGAIILLALIMIPYTRKVLKEDERQKQKVRIQAEIIEEKNKDITDSINYALKIQNTILPNIDQFKPYFGDIDILYKPKDIVAGDFFFLDKVGDDVYVAAADCTGHGVPGAMVSVICSNALSYALHEKNLNSTGEVLDQVRKRVVEKFSSSPDGIKDGMDVSLCKFNIKTGEMEYSGANNAVYVLKNGSKELDTLNPDKQPVGQFDHATPFTTHSIQLQKGDQVYLFSDGYADQFGGDKGKKLKYKSFKQMILDASNEEMSSQIRNLDIGFEKWKGDFEQVDDVCLIGVRF